MDGNPNKSHIEYIEGLIMQIGEQLSQISPETAEQHEAKNEVYEYLNLFQLNQIKDLRMAFE